jgi:glycosyltransferase involved in cell wall biosynthesis
MAEMSTPRVSIVTPFYNTAPYLGECIESVLAQTHREFEYVLLNNRSTDGSLQIAQSYARRDARIRLIDCQTHVPQVPNYNRALASISPHSEYCKVVQADDWIYPECVQKMVELADRNPSVGLVSSYYFHGANICGAGIAVERRVVAGRELCRMQLLDNSRFFFGSPTTVLYRTAALRGRQPVYSESAMHEDTELCYELLRDWDFGFVHQILSYSRKENPSVTQSVRDHGLTLLDHLINVTKFGPEYLSAEELARCRAQARSRYMRFLGISLLRARGERFWDYHARGLQSIGLSLSRLELVFPHALLGLWAALRRRLSRGAWR